MRVSYGSSSSLLMALPPPRCLDTDVSFTRFCGSQGFSIDRLRRRFFLLGLDDWSTRDLHHVPSPITPHHEPERKQFTLPSVLIYGPIIVRHYYQADALGSV